MKRVSLPSFRSVLVGSLGAAVAVTFLPFASSPRFIAQMGGENACDNVDNDGTGVVDEGCYACKAGERFVLGNRTYCFSFASFGLDLSAANAECRSFGGQLASYTDGETRVDVMELIAKYASIAYKQPVYPQALIIKSTCQEMTAVFRQPDADLYQDTGVTPGVMDCSYPILMHSGSQEGKLNDGIGGAGNGAVCEIMDGWCCVTDGQACVPMTLEQCDASGIGFAQDQTTCNILCGVKEGSSSSTSSLPSSSRSPSSVSPASSSRNSSSSASSVSPVSSYPASSASSWSSTSSTSLAASSFAPSSSYSPSSVSLVSSPARSSTVFSRSLLPVSSVSSTSSVALSSLSLSLLIPPQCSDDIDNDRDGKKDFPADPGCFALGDDDESNDSRSAAPESTASGPPQQTQGLGEEVPADFRIPTQQFLQLPTTADGGICGDSLCSVMENAEVCPKDCRAMGIPCKGNTECDTGLCSQGKCVPCTMTTDCPHGWQCLARRCLPQPLTQQAQVLDEWQIPEQFQVPGIPQDLPPNIYHLKPIPAQPGTGPELLAIMAAGAAGGWAWMRRRRTIPSPHIAR